MARDQSTYQEIQKSFKEVRKKLQELRKSNADPEVIKFVRAHLRWIEQQVTEHKAEFYRDSLERKSHPTAKKAT